MKKIVIRKHSRPIRAVVMTAISMTVFLVGLLVACNLNLNQGDATTRAGQDFLAGRCATCITGTGTGAAASILGTASNFAVLAGTTVTNDGASIITGDLGVSPGTAITGFEPAPANTIMGPGTVTAGLGVVSGTIYARGPVADQAHNDALVAYNYLIAQVPTTTYAGVTQLDGMTFTPGIYAFAPSANLLVNGTLYLDFQGNSNAQFIFQMGTTLVTMAGSKVIALNNNNAPCAGANVYWAVGSSATINGAQFVGTVVALTTITMTADANVSGRMLALNGAVTMITDTIGTCAGSGGTGGTPGPCAHNDYVSGGGWIQGNSTHHGYGYDLDSFGVSGGIKNGQYWGQLSFNDHGNGVKVKSTMVTAYLIIDAKTRQIEGIAKLNGRDSVTFKVVVIDNGRFGRHNQDSFSIELSNGYSASGLLKGGSIQIHVGGARSFGVNFNHDKDESDGNNRSDNDRNWR